MPSSSLTRSHGLSPAAVLAAIFSTTHALATTRAPAKLQQTSEPVSLPTKHICVTHRHAGVTNAPHGWWKMGQRRWPDASADWNQSHSCMISPVSAFQTSVPNPHQRQQKTRVCISVSLPWNNDGWRSNSQLELLQFLAGYHEWRECPMFVLCLGHQLGWQNLPNHSEKPVETHFLMKLRTLEPWWSVVGGAALSAGPGALMRMEGLMKRHFLTSVKNLKMNKNFTFHAKPTTGWFHQRKPEDLEFRVWPSQSSEENPWTGLCAQEMHV